MRDPHRHAKRYMVFPTTGYGYLPLQRRKTLAIRNKADRMICTTLSGHRNPLYILYGIKKFGAAAPVPGHRDGCYTAPDPYTRYLSSQASSMRQPLYMLFTCVVRPLT